MQTTIKVIAGMLLRNLRKKQGIEAADAAAIFHTGRANYCGMEQGRVAFSVFQLQGFCRKQGISSVPFIKDLEDTIQLLEDHGVTVHDSVQPKEVDMKSIMSFVDVKNCLADIHAGRLPRK